MRKRSSLLILGLLALSGCRSEEADTPPGAASSGRPASADADLSQARKGFVTKLTRRLKGNEPAPAPPPELFRLVKYPSPGGEMAAYVGTDPGDGKAHPAIVWIFGGFGNDIGDPAWTPQRPDNDQSASAFREAGLVMMYPSLRGGNTNPGVQEGFLGEVDDVLAAADFLSKQPYIDPKRIYLGGHSTGGTLVLLAAEMSDRFRAVFAFGPIDDVRGYGPDNAPFDLSDARECEVRSPVRWIATAKSPVFAFEGAAGGNIPSLQSLSRAASGNPKAHFYSVAGASHFSILAPVTRVVAQKIVADDGPTMNIAFTEAELNAAMSSR